MCVQTLSKSGSGKSEAMLKEAPDQLSSLMLFPLKNELDKIKYLFK